MRRRLGPQKVSRLHIDESYWAKETRIRKKTGLEEEVIFYSIGRLWHNSQEDEILLATRDELIDLMEASHRDSDVRRLLVDGFLHAGFITLEEDEDSGELYRITGNEDHIGSIKKSKLTNSQRAKRAAEARWSKGKSRQDSSDAQDNAQADAQASIASATDATRQDRAGQGIAGQGKTNHNRAGQDTSAGPPLKVVKFITPENLDEFDTEDPETFTDGPIHPDVVMSLWDKYIQPVSKISAPTEQSMAPDAWEKISRVLQNSVLAMPLLSTWVTYFEIIKAGDWYRFRRNTFNFKSVITLENIEAEFQKRNISLPGKVEEGAYAH